MAETRASLRSSAQGDNTIFEILHYANRILLEGSPPDQFVTGMLMQINAADRTLEYCAAGHPSGYIFGGDGRLRLELRGDGHPLGLIDNPEFTISPRHQILEGDTLVLLTDGVLEAMAPGQQMLGTARVKEAIAAACGGSAAEVVAHLLATVREHCRPGLPQDDVTVVVVKAIALEN
jgi:serine phosphatase RsbU (regulator of sigma subunit)